MEMERTCLEKLPKEIRDWVLEYVVAEDNEDLSDEICYWSESQDGSAFTPGSASSFLAWFGNRYPISLASKQFQHESICAFLRINALIKRSELHRKDFRFHKGLAQVLKLSKAYRSSVPTFGFAVSHNAIGAIGDELIYLLWTVKKGLSVTIASFLRLGSIFGTFDRTGKRNKDMISFLPIVRIGHDIPDLSFFLGSGIFNISFSIAYNDHGSNFSTITSIDIFPSDMQKSKHLLEKHFNQLHEELETVSAALAARIANESSDLQVERYDTLEAQKRACVSWLNHLHLYHSVLIKMLTRMWALREVNEDVTRLRNVAISAKETDSAATYLALILQAVDKADSPRAIRELLR